MPTSILKSLCLSDQAAWKLHQIQQKQSPGSFVGTWKIRMDPTGNHWPKNVKKSKLLKLTPARLTHNKQTWRPTTHKHNCIYVQLLRLCAWYQTRLNSNLNLRIIASKTKIFDPTPPVFGFDLKLTYYKQTQLARNHPFYYLWHGEFFH